PLHYHNPLPTRRSSDLQGKIPLLRRRAGTAACKNSVASNEKNGSGDDAPRQQEKCNPSSCPQSLKYTAAWYLKQEIAQEKNACADRKSTRLNSSHQIIS